MQNKAGTILLVEIDTARDLFENCNRLLHCSVRTLSMPLKSYYILLQASKFETSGYYYSKFSWPQKLFPSTLSFYLFQLPLTAESHPSHHSSLPPFYLLPILTAATALQSFPAHKNRDGEQQEQKKG